MHYVAHSIETIKYRLGKMDDALLRDLSLSPQSRDIFCSKPIILTEQKGILAAIDIAAYRQADKKLEPVIFYHPYLNRVENKDACLKIIAHECGHALHFLHDDTDHFNMALSRYIFLPLYVRPIFGIAKNCLQSATQKTSRRQFLKSMGSNGLELTAAHSIKEMAPPYFSRQIERHADYIADAIVPEHSFRHAINQFLSYCSNKNALLVKAQRPLRLKPFDGLLTTHPSYASRFAASEKNCKKFAKNSLLWD